MKMSNEELKFTVEMDHWERVILYALLAEFYEVYRRYAVWSAETELAKEILDYLI